MPLTPEAFIDGWCCTPAEREYMWDEFIAAGLIAPPVQLGPERPLVLVQQGWWPSYRSRMAEVYRFKKVGNW